MGGAEALRQVRAANIDIPIIALTATVDQDELQREGTLDAGFTDVTTKPLKRDKAREILEKYGHKLLPENAPKSQLKASGKSQPSASTRAAGAAPGASMGGGAHPAAADGKKHVLVVEDDPTSQKIIQRLLEREGLGVELALNGVDAVAMAVKTPYHAILMDCDMPLKDGWQATRDIRDWVGWCRLTLSNPR
jgi:CheY-like chemotaxis protein